MKPQLKLLRSRVPEWAALTAHAGSLRLKVDLPRPSGVPDQPLTLRVWISDSKVDICEEPPRQWPHGCPERHINQDGTFCLGVGAPISPQSAEDADTWWSWLKQFILSQRVASRTGRWPSARALHHGDAVIYQLQLERLCLGTRFEAEVHSALEGECNWLSGDLPRLSKDGIRLVNLRSPCPRGCQRKGRPVIRRKCKSKEVVFEIVRAERRRRSEEARFWESWKSRPCCQTMKTCPLR